MAEQLSFPVTPVIAIVDEPISLDASIHPIPPSSGAVVEFSGIVRDSEGGVTIAGIDYESFREMARSELNRIAEDVIERYNLTDLVCIHRVGFVPVHDSAVFIRTSARHRQAAFEANMEFIERLKARVPIWKHPVIDGPVRKPSL